MLNVLPKHGIGKENSHQLDRGIDSVIVSYELEGANVRRFQIFGSGSFPRKRLALKIF